MKFFLTTLSMIALAATTSIAQQAETPAVIGLKAGGNPQGFIKGSGAAGIVFSTQQGAPGNQITWDKLRGEGLNVAIQLNDGTQMLAQGKSLFNQGQYEAAAASFGKVADTFEKIVSFIPRNFATEARYRQIESLRRLGKFPELPPLMDSIAGKNIESKLDPAFMKQHTFNKLWSAYGAGDVAAVKAGIEMYQVPVVGDTKLLPTPNFKKMPPAELVQVAFLRGKVYNSTGETAKALEDYYRAFTLSLGNDKALGELAMLEALKIQKANPAVDDEKNTSARWAIESIAFQFQNIFGASALPSEYAKYAVKPDVPAFALPEDEPAPPADAEKAAPAPAAKEGEAKKPEPKAKGKAKKKGKAK